MWYWFDKMVTVKQSHYSHQEHKEWVAPKPFSPARILFWPEAQGGLVWRKASKGIISSQLYCNRLQCILCVYYLVPSKLFSTFQPGFPSGFPSGSINLIDCTPFQSTVLSGKDLSVPPEPALPSLVWLSLGCAPRSPATLIPVTSLLAWCPSPCIGSVGNMLFSDLLLTTLPWRLSSGVKSLGLLPRSAQMGSQLLRQTHCPGIFQEPRLHTFLPHYGSRCLCPSEASWVQGLYCRYLPVPGLPCYMTGAQSAFAERTHE